MSKRNITYIKPEEPSFLRKLKEQVGYKEGPTVDTKKEQLLAPTEEDFEDKDEEQPTVVVLHPGDLTAEEADEFIESKKEEEEASKDINAPIIFAKPTKNSSSSNKSTSKRPSSSSSSSSEEKDTKEGKRKKITNKSLLSFDDEVDE